MSRRVARGMGRLASAGAGAALARVVLGRLRSSPGASALERTNYHGRTVSLAAGPALAAAATVSAAGGAALAGEPGLAGASLVAGLGCGVLGCYDDIVGARPEQKAAKGFRGHLAALREGTITSGLIKVAGIGAAGLAAAALLPPRRPSRATGRVVDTLLGAGVIAGTANLVNLLDLRPGRALKTGLIIGVPLVASRAGAAVAGPVGAATALLPDDLDEQVMLGDAGANALGGLLGVALAARSGRAGRAGLLAALVALTVASEKVSFTKVIEGTPGLRDLDRFGRRPAPAAPERRA